MSNNKVIIQLELTPDDELVARNAVNGDVMIKKSVDPYVAGSVVVSIDVVLTVISAELNSLLVEQNPATSERYT